MAECRVHYPANVFCRRDQRFIECKILDTRQRILYRVLLSTKKHSAKTVFTVCKTLDIQRPSAKKDLQNVELSTHHGTRQRLSVAVYSWRLLPMPSARKRTMSKVMSLSSVISRRSAKQVYSECLALTLGKVYLIFFSFFTKLFAVYWYSI
jgi:hypothetical protein